jgi:hypothetical protein
MDAPQSSSFPQPNQANSAAATEFQAPAQDYGSLGPSSDITGPHSLSTRSSLRRFFAPLAAVALGALAAIFVASMGSARPTLSKPFSGQENSPTPEASAGLNSRQLDGMKPQKQAEALLEAAIGDSHGAMAQISSRVGQWHGKLQWNSQIANLTTAALNSRDTRVRESAVEIELAAYGLSKNAASLNYLLRAADSSDHAQKIWALWALGLMGNRGVETGRVAKALVVHLKDSDQDSRRWAVEGLSLVATDETLAPLLTAMHDDPSAAVRERAACSLAESGMFTREQRFSVVPRLLSYTDDPSLDAQTHAWVFQALTEITRQHLPNDSAAWRAWYASQAASFQ